MAKGVKHFLAFTHTYNARTNRVLSDIEVFEAFDPANPPNSPTSFKTTALWDTGATGSSISPAVAQHLGLIPSGTQKMITAAGEHMSPMFMVNFGLPNGVGVPGINAAQIAPQADFDVLLGMDVITLGDFSITNVEGKTTMSFRIPSIKTIDYVQMANTFKYRNVGRNALCPCGSNEKFKKCHGKKK